MYRGLLHPLVQLIKLKSRRYSLERLRLQRKLNSWPKPAARKILIADDDASTRRLLQKTLESAGFEVTAVENGRLALDCLSRKEAPRLVLLDWLMPEMNGLSVCQEIRRHSENPYIYIILLSAKAAKHDIVTGLEAGADDYLTKPFDTEELKARLRAGERVLKLEDKLTHDALHDPLTQLPNRAF